MQVGQPQTWSLADLLWSWAVLVSVWAANRPVPIFGESLRMWTVWATAQGQNWLPTKSGYLNAAWSIAFLDISTIVPIFFQKMHFDDGPWLHWEQWFRSCQPMLLEKLATVKVSLSLWWWVTVTLKSDIFPLNLCLAMVASSLVKFLENSMWTHLAQWPTKMKPPTCVSCDRGHHLASIGVSSLRLWNTAKETACLGHTHTTHMMEGSTWQLQVCQAWDHKTHPQKLLVQDTHHPFNWRVTLGGLVRVGCRNFFLFGFDKFTRWALWSRDVMVPNSFSDILVTQLTLFDSDLTAASLQWTAVLNFEKQLRVTKDGKKSDNWEALKISKSSSAVHWTVAFCNLCHQKVGVHLISCVHLIQEDVDTACLILAHENNTSHTETHDSVAMNVIVMASHTHHCFKIAISTSTMALKSLQGAPSVPP